MEEECRHCMKWKEHCRKFEEHFYWDHVDAKMMHFSKLMTGDFSSCMVIPKKFIDHFKGELLKTIELKVPSGDKWHVELKNTCDGVVLDSGWRNFVLAHGIQENDTLVFKYDGCSSFIVLMFEKGGCEKASSYCAKKRDPMEDSCIMVSSKKLGHGCYESSPEHYVQSEPLIVVRKSARENRVAKAKQVRNKLNAKRIRRRKKHFTGTRRKKNLIEQESEILEGTLSNSSGVSLANLSNSKKFIISKKTRLTDPEMNMVLSLAETVKSDGPFFISVMVPCSALKRFYLTIPMSFAVKYLPRTSCRILLQLSDGERVWPAQCLVQRNTVGFSSGWKEFVLEHRLKVGDICLFVLQKADEDEAQNIFMTVHISRADPILL